MRKRFPACVRWGLAHGTTGLSRHCACMDVVEITNSAALERIYPDWVALWEQLPGATPFQHPDWLLPWWRHVGAGALFVIAVQDRGGLSALAPFYVHADEQAGVRQLTLLGNGITDSCDVLIDPARSDLLQRMAAELSGSRERVWNACDFRDIPACSVLLALMRDAFGARQQEDDPRVVVPLASWSSEESDPLPAKIRADLRRRRKRAEAIGRVRLVLAEQHSTADALEELFALHSSRWNALGQSGVLSEPKVAAFHLDVAERFGRRGWLRLYNLQIGNRVAAANYGFFVNGRAYSYIGGFAPEFAHLGVGRLILHDIIRHAAAEGAAEFDLLRGQEDYKLKWGGRLVQQYRFQLSMRGDVVPSRSPLKCGRPC